MLEVAEADLAPCRTYIDPLPAEGGSRPDCRIEHDEVRRVVVRLMKHDTDLFRLFSDNASFERWLAGRCVRDNLPIDSAAVTAVQAGFGSHFPNRPQPLDF
jgi:hypothetical protein